MHYDDNFGHWHDMEDPEMQDFYERTQRTNVKKICSICGEEVMIQPHYDKCNACCVRIGRAIPRWFVLRNSKVTRKNISSELRDRLAWSPVFTSES